jgi:hypothetical protein
MNAVITADMCSTNVSTFREFKLGEIGKHHRRGNTYNVTIHQGGTDVVTKVGDYSFGGSTLGSVEFITFHRKVVNTLKQFEVPYLVADESQLIQIGSLGAASSLVDFTLQNIRDTTFTDPAGKLYGVNVTFLDFLDEHLYGDAKEFLQTLPDEILGRDLYLKLIDKYATEVTTEDPAMLRSQFLNYNPSFSTCNKFIKVSHIISDLKGQNNRHTNLMKKVDTLPNVFSPFEIGTAYINATSSHPKFKDYFAYSQTIITSERLITHSDKHERIEQILYTDYESWEGAKKQKFSDLVLKLSNPTVKEPEPIIVEDGAHLASFAFGDGNGKGSKGNKGNKGGGKKGGKKGGGKKGGKMRLVGYSYRLECINIR